jgi:hypothetical protein
MSTDIIDNNLRNVIHLCYEMLEHADHGDRFRKDAGCGVVYGTLRDTAYKIRQLAEEELSQHSRKSGTSSPKKKDVSDSHPPKAKGNDLPLRDNP